MKISMNPKCGVVNANTTMLLLDSYLNEIKQVEQLVRPSSGVLNGNMNRFYTFIINSIGSYIDTIDAYADIAKFIELVLLIKKHLELIDQMKLWQACGIMRPQLELLGTLISLRDLDRIDECKRRMDRMLSDPNTSVFKLPIIKQTLYPNLVLALRNRNVITPEKLNEQIEFLVNANINNPEVKEDFMFEFSCKFADSKQKLSKYYSLSRDGLINKYGLDKKLDFAGILDVVLSANQPSASNIFYDLVSILNDDQTLGLDEMLVLYKKLRPSVFSSLPVSRLEYQLSERVEKSILAAVAPNNQDFADVVKDLLQERTKHIIAAANNSLKLLVEVKWALYNKLRSVLFKDKKPVDENALKSIFLILRLARGRLDCVSDSPPPLNADDEAIIKKVNYFNLF